MKGGKALLPRTFCQRSVSRTSEGWVIHYFTQRDQGWLEALLQMYRTHAGQKHGTLRQHLTDPLKIPSTTTVPPGRTA